MKRKKAALYDPYLDVLGGGERYALTILQELEKQTFDPYIFWDTDITSDISAKLNLQFANKPTFATNIFHTPGVIKKITELRQFDILLYVTNGSYFFSPSKKNFIYCMVPRKDLYTMNIANKAKTANATFITHSKFVQGWLQKWGVDAQVLYPPLSRDFIDIPVQSIKKDKIIISVGRFFKQLHSKRQDITIKLYKQLKQNNKNYKDYKLILAGGLKKEDQEYFNELIELAQDDSSIIFKPNIPYKDLLALYKSSQMYWHMAGYDVDENEHPDLVEHLGISPLEAMAAGCITFCYNAGGLKELVQDGINGYLFSNSQELLLKCGQIQKDKTLQESVKSNAKKFVTEQFSQEVFAKHVKDIFL